MTYGLRQHGALSRRFISTAIPYVNSAPHIGFALEIVQADALARHYRASGNTVHFQTGTDENSLKNVQAAEAARIAVKDFVALNAAKFHDLRNALSLSFDTFIRTSSEPKHAAGASRLWDACFRGNDIYKKVYTGLYCVGCEQFYKESELLDGKCPEHGVRPEAVEEENWFFRLSHYSSALRDLITSRTIEIVPDSRRNEVLAWIDNGLEDFSISRSSQRAKGWGIPVPNDPTQVMYVWFDALANYITSLNYANDGEAYQDFWGRSASREHVIGKGISRFHALYWPAILLSAGLPLPTRILIHGYVTVEGSKISKSIGNAIDPIPLVREYGTDALRYYLLRHIRPTEDGDFSIERLQLAYSSELSGQLGNLVHRVLSMVERYVDGRLPTFIAERLRSNHLVQKSSVLQDEVATLIEQFAFDRALDRIFAFVSEANKYVTVAQPWNVYKLSQSADGSDQEQTLHDILAALILAILVISDSLRPLLPDAAKRICDKFDVNLATVDVQQLLGGTISGTSVQAGPPLFPPLHLQG